MWTEQEKYSSQESVDYNENIDYNEVGYMYNGKLQTIWSFQNEN